MPKKKVLVSAPYFLPVVDRFKSILDENNIELVLPDVDERLEEDELLAVIRDIDGVICGDDRFTEKVLQAASKLKVISKWGTGIDSIDQEACQKHGVAVKNTPNAFTEPVADSVLAYILCFARKTPWMDKAMKDGIWEKIPGVSLREKTLGIIGVGNIGKAVTRRAIGFGMRVLGNDIKAIDEEFIEMTGLRMVAKDVIYGEADFISVNCDLNPASQHLINHDAFKKMKRQPYIINTARGPIIKEKDLIDALKSGTVSGAGMDVFEDEPLPQNSPLLKMDNVLLAPHNSNSSPVAWEYVHQNTVSNLLEEMMKDEK
ncbi:MAG: phosphoglycerate dehydrogenase [Candidatus Omnitrophica bacterium]|nr:phosphoglycerate dehydrogenase [Candidatus Omnitrophota bacterium]